MPDTWTLEEMVRTFLYYRDQEHRKEHDALADDFKWWRRTILGALGAAVLASIGSSIFAGIRG